MASSAIPMVCGAPADASLLRGFFVGVELLDAFGDGDADTAGRVGEADAAGRDGEGVIALGVYRSRLGEPATLEMVFCVAMLRMRLTTVPGALDGSSSAATPATCGDDIDVPLMVVEPPPSAAPRVHTPGANSVTHEP